MADYFIFAIVGIFAGVLAGFLGIGGGTVMVPAMVALGIPGIQAVGTSTLAILVIAAAGSFQNWRMGYLDIKRVLLLGLPALVTSFAGKELADAFPEYILLGTFGLFLLFNIYLIGIKKKVVSQAKKQTAGPEPTPESAASDMNSTASNPQQKTVDGEDTVLNPAISRIFIGGIAGFLAGLFGVGGGVVMVPLQILMLKEDIKTAIQTSLGAIVITATSAALWHATDGNVLFLTGLIFGFGGLVGVQVSTRYLPKLSDQTVTFMFRMLLALLAVFFFYKAWGSYASGMG